MKANTDNGLGRPLAKYDRTPSQGHVGSAGGMPVRHCRLSCCFSVACVEPLVAAFFSHATSRAPSARLSLRLPTTMRAINPGPVAPGCAVYCNAIGHSTDFPSLRDPKQDMHQVSSNHASGTKSAQSVQKARRRHARNHLGQASTARGHKSPRQRGQCQHTDWACGYVLRDRRSEPIHRRVHAHVCVCVCLCVCVCMSVCVRASAGARGEGPVDVFLNGCRDRHVPESLQRS